jgi:hypothetical protein
LTRLALGRRGSAHNNAGVVCAQRYIPKCRLARGLVAIHVVVQRCTERESNLPLCLSTIVGDFSTLPGLGIRVMLDEHHLRDPATCVELFTILMLLLAVIRLVLRFALQFTGSTAASCRWTAICIEPSSISHRQNRFSVPN